MQHEIPQHKLAEPQGVFKLDRILEQHQFPIFQQFPQKGK